MEDGVLLKYGMLCLILCLSDGKANETRIDMVDFLLGRMYKVDERLDKMEQKIFQKDAPKPTEPHVNRHIDIEELVDDINLKISKMLKAFGTEKKHLQTKTKELFDASVFNKIKIDELHKTLALAVGKIDTVESVLNQLKIQIENNKEEHKEAFGNMKDGFEEETLELTKEIRAFRKAIGNVTINIENLKNQQQLQINDVSEQMENLKKDLDSTKLETKKTICPVGWKRQLESCILYVTNKNKSWSKAQNHCKKKGAVLAEPNSNIAFDLLRDEIPIGSGRFWLGGNDIDSEGSWIWSFSGRKVRLDKWGDGEPNDDGGEDCLELIQTYLLNDLPCSSKQNFICEIKYE